MRFKIKSYYRNVLQLDARDPDGATLSFDRRNRSMNRWPILTPLGMGTASLAADGRLSLKLKFGELKLKQLWVDRTLVASGVLLQAGETFVAEAAAIAIKLDDDSVETQTIGLAIQNQTRNFHRGIKTDDQHVPPRGGCGSDLEPTPWIRLSGLELKSLPAGANVSTAKCREYCCAAANCSGWMMPSSNGDDTERGCTLLTGELTPHKDFAFQSGRVGTPPTHYGSIDAIGDFIPTHKQWSGYARVSTDTSLFYHAIRSDNASAPLLLWTNGGPGASSIAYGDFFQKIGPFAMVPTSEGKNYSLGENPLSWISDFSLLFIDHPAPTGLSVSMNPPRTQEANAVEYVTALEMVVKRHALNLDAGLYMSGESYAGRFIPSISERMLAVGVPLTGVLIGNGEVDPESAFRSYGPWLFGLGYISEGQLDELNALAANCTRLVQAELWAEATSVCYQVRSRASHWTGDAFWTYDVRDGSSAAQQPYAHLQSRTEAMLDSPAIREAMHAQQSGPSITAGGVVAWAGFNSSGDFLKSSAQSVGSLMEAGVRVLIYTGQFDECMNVLSTSNWMMEKLPSWKSNASQHIVQMSDFVAMPRTQVMGSFVSQPATTAESAADGSVRLSSFEVVVGFHRRLDLLSQMIVLRAGHMCTLEQPVVAKQMFVDFASGVL